MERLGQAIKLGVVPPGERFPTERELAEQLGVSRVTVREALRALEQSGMVEIRRGRFGGTYVIGTDARPSKSRARRMAKALGRDLQDSLDLRWAVEPATAELAARRRSDEDVVRARELLREAENAPREPRALRSADSRFHLALADMAESPSLAAAAADLQLRLSELLSALPILDESLRHSRAQHARILEAIEARDGAAARAAMEEHLSATAQLLHGLS